jgi:hypothetical protein
MPHEEDDFNLFYPKPFLDKSDTFGKRAASPSDLEDRTEATMKKILTICFAAALATALYNCASQGQLGEKGCNKTLTLPNGETVCDLNGEWDIHVHFYGPWSEITDAFGKGKITQTGNFCEVVRMKDSIWGTKGSVMITFFIDKDGFKKAEALTASGILQLSGKISDDGNKLIFDDFHDGQYPVPVDRQFTKLCFEQDS